MTLHWHQVTRHSTASKAVDELKTFGIEMRQPLAAPMEFYWSEEANSVLVALGNIYSLKDGRILIRPRSDCHGHFLQVLIGSAINAWSDKATRRKGWRTRRAKEGTYWWTAVVARPPEDNHVAKAVLAARKSYLQSDELEYDLKSFTVTPEWKLAGADS